MKNKIESKNLQLLDDGTKVQGKILKAAYCLKRLLSSYFNSMQNYNYGNSCYPVMRLDDLKQAKQKTGKNYLFQRSMLRQLSLKK